MCAMRIVYCIKCGNPFPEKAIFCPFCGAKVYRLDDDTATYVEEKIVADKDAKTIPVSPDKLEDPKIGICILSFFFPIVGFIAAASNRKTNKKKSKSYAMWAWIGFAIGFLSRLIQATL